MKNKFSRLASVMLVLTLLTTCAVSGTYAKYVTTASASDTARVAKFGVQISTNTTANKSLFSATYTTHDEAVKAQITNSVASANGTDKVVAPGTSQDGSSYFSITGTPEVAVRITYSIGAGYTEPHIDEGTYTNYTGNGGATFPVAEGGYYPVTFTLTDKNGTKLASGKLDDISKYLSNHSMVYGPNQDLSSLGDTAFTLSWKWEYGDANAVTDNDRADTLMGNAAVSPINGVVTDLNFDLTVTVTQID